MKVFSNLASSLDGRIARSDAPAQPLGTAYDRKMMQVLRKKADIIVFGAETLKIMKTAAKVKGQKFQPANAVLTTTGDLPSDIPFWSENSVKRFVLTTKQGYENAINACRGRAFVVPIGDTILKVQTVLNFLKEMNFKNVLVEGGGKVIHSFLKEDCIDEMYVTLVPKVIGGAENPSLVSGESFRFNKQLKLKKVSRKKDELYLCYQLKKQRKK